MKKLTKRLLGAMLAIIMVVSILPNGVFKVSVTAATAQSDYATGNIIVYGSYPQTKVTDSTLITTLNAQTLQTDNTVTYDGSKYKRVYFTTPTNSYQTTNGFNIKTVYWFKFESLQWRVLSNTNGELFVMADKILESRPYNQDLTDVTWETCTMRTWLNNDFYNTAFNSTEQSRIKLTPLINGDNYYGTEGGNNTNDKLFLLSNSEVTNTAYGFSSGTARIAQGTDFSKSNGLYVRSGNSYWWSRSPGLEPYYAGVLHYGGTIFIGNYNVNYNYIGIRPAFKINLSSNISTSYENFNYIPNTYNKDLAVRCSDYTLSLYDSWQKFQNKITKEEEASKYTNKFEDFQHYNFDKNVTEDNSGVVFAKKKVIYNNQVRTLTLVTIAGTMGVQWQSDMDATGLTYNSANRIHSSFLASEIDIKNKLNQYLSANENSLLLITGHSRGAAVANLLADDLTGDKLGGKVSNVFAYTFAAPNTTKDPHKDRTNIFNLCFSDDFVPNFPLKSWGYDKHGITITVCAQALYNLVPSFKNDMNTFAISHWRLLGADFDSLSTSALLFYVKSRWENVDEYYNKQPISFFGPVAYLDNTLHDFLKYAFAPAAMPKGDVSLMLGKLTSTTYLPIVIFFLVGNTLRANVSNSHEPFTYYTATKYIDYNAKQSLLQTTQAKINDGTTSPTSPNQTELQKLKTFAQQDDNLQKLGWDINDCTTWQGLTWDTEAENRITEINISFFDLTGTLDLTDFTSLKSLNCSGNFLKGLGLNSCVLLQDLNCAYNLLPELSIADLTSLRVLDCSFNQLEELNVANCSGLTKLTCNNNLLAELNVANNTVLTDLYCRGNKLTSLDFSSNTQLLNLSCEENYLDIQNGSDFMSAITQLSQMDNSSVKYNPQKMPENPVFNTSDISKLTAYANQNDNLAKLGWDLSKPQKWYGIEWIRVNDVYFANSINISNFGLEGSLDLSGMANLSFLNCSGNKLSNINVSGCTGIVYLNCSNSKVEGLNISNCSSLLMLNCDRNYLDISSGNTLLSDINQVELKENSDVNYLTQYISAEISSFNQNEYLKLVEFANTADNLQALGWDVEKPGEWTGIVWTLQNGEYQVKEICLDGYSVSDSIDLSSFSELSNVDFSSSKITSITLPSSMIEIQDSSFDDCNELVSVNLPNSIVSIGAEAFNNCTSLINIAIPNSVTNIDMLAFSDCTSLEKMTIQNNLTNFKLFAISGCDNLVIYCLIDSYAEKYAMKNAISYILYPEIRKIAGSNAVVDRQKCYIYGLTAAMTLFDGIIETVGGATTEVIPCSGATYGTGSIVNVMFDGEIVKTYTIIIFGDVNGDGNIDSMDAGTMVDVENDAISWDLTTDAEYFKAGDLNGDVNIDSIDAGLAVDYENGMVTIDQSTGIAVSGKSDNVNFGLPQTIFMSLEATQFY